jgi:hypothetical protein
MPSENIIRGMRGGTHRAASNNFAQNGKCMVASAFPFKRKQHRLRFITINLAAKNRKDPPNGL